ncbi:hypothetical protein [Streptomyces puniciscabiei]|uniref:hypothetical protein n=1 Tax=Streptomyces puniciscabiei TaxID=164348 RepID=UPI00332AA546
MLNELEALAARQRVTAAYADHEWAPHPDVDFDDLRAAKRLAWTELERAGAPLDAPGGRLYLIGFVGPGPNLKLGMVTRTPSSPDNSVLKYLKSHERRANAYGCFLVRGWISRPVKAMVRHWEEKALNAVGALDGAFRDGEYFYDADFDAAVEAAKAARKNSLAH